MGGVRRTRNQPHGIKVQKCAHLQCDKPRKCMQLCHAHYRRMADGISIAEPLERRRGPSEICKAPGCVGDVWIANLCETHWIRAVRIVEARASAAHECTVPGCSRELHEDGLCRWHWRRDLDEPIPYVTRKAG